MALYVAYDHVQVVCIAAFNVELMELQRYFTLVFFNSYFQGKHYVTKE